MKTSFVFLVLMVLVAISFSLQITVNAQTSYVTVYGQLTQFQCPVGDVSGPCTGLSLTTNGTTPGIPDSPMLDFSQSLDPAPAQSDVGKSIMATGYYGQESPCTIVKSCPAFFVHTWGQYSDSASPRSLSSTKLAIIATVVVVAVAAYLLTHRKKQPTAKVPRTTYSELSNPYHNFEVLGLLAEPNVTLIALESQI